MAKTKPSSHCPDRPGQRDRPRTGRAASSREAGAGAAPPAEADINADADVPPGPQSYTTIGGRVWRIHPLAALMPWMTDAEYRRLKDSIRAIGELLAPIIVTPTGEVLDGRHRLRACVELGIEPWVVVREEVESYLDVVLDANDGRRQLNSSQRALVAARLATLGRGRPGVNAPIGAFTQQAAAERLGVSRTRVQAARKLVTRGCPGLIKLVDEGRLPLPLAARVADLDGARQRRLAEQGPRSIREWAASPTPREAPKRKGRARVPLEGGEDEPGEAPGGEDRCAPVSPIRPDVIAAGAPGDATGADDAADEAGAKSSAWRGAPEGTGPSRGRESRPEGPAGPGDRRPDERATTAGEAATSRGTDAGDRPAPNGPERRSSAPGDGDPAAAGDSRHRGPYRRAVPRLARHVEDNTTLEVEAWIAALLRPVVEKIRRAEAEDPAVRRFLNPSFVLSTHDSIPTALAILKKLPPPRAWIPCRSCQCDPEYPQSKCLLCGGKGYQSIPGY